MKSFGRTTVSEFLGDRIVFRNLIPCDPHLPGLPDLRQNLGFPEGFLPRKSMPEYGVVIVEMLRSASNIPLRSIIYIGDTRMNDGRAFMNICEASGLPGVAFIGADKPEPLNVQHERLDSGILYEASRWKALDQFEPFVAEQGLTIDEQTAILFDLDKTIVGARGRNDRVIDMKRLQAAEDTLLEALGDDFDPVQFRSAYQELNKVEFHPFTADNQDYLVFICLIVSSGLISLEDLTASVRNGKQATFQDFLAFVEENKSSLPQKVRGLHSDVFNRVHSGDPTPFKTFRYNEFKRTVQHMGHLPDTAPIGQMLSEEIVITEEVRKWANLWKSRGALLFGLSDKPDEAILPTEVLAAQGYLPIHQTPTHAIGEE